MSGLTEKSTGSGASGHEPPATVARIRIACRQCSEALDSGDNFCRYCGGLTETGAARFKIGKLSPPISLEPAEKPLGWTESPVVVLLALFAVLGPLALPMLWRSRCFTLAWKIGLTVVVLLVTGALCWYIADVWQKTVAEFRRSGLI